MEKIVEFYSPHPGSMGALMLVPIKVQEVAKRLDGKRMTVAEAIAKLKKVTDGKIKDVPSHHFISLTIAEGDVIHCFRVIRYKPCD